MWGVCAWAKISNKEKRNWAKAGYTMISQCYWICMVRGGHLPRTYIEILDLVPSSDTQIRHRLSRVLAHHTKAFAFGLNSDKRYKQESGRYFMLALNICGLNSSFANHGELDSEESVCINFHVQRN